MESLSFIPVWAFAILAFGVQFWLFCLLPSWINTDADVIAVEAEERGMPGEDTRPGR